MIVEVGIYNSKRVEDIHSKVGKIIIISVVNYSLL